ncbi:hypothetical protein E3N88_19273 [Mikania micrantha]|uniref:Replication factor A C-terminal domain-containing protein n=1 Tax=Mikania micrantha TaxID=192012 RepID=A0A5N6NQR0_9ASTR|nr:hypothetical protein E3N88_19273 [Mikania micrantha]
MMNILLLAPLTNAFDIIIAIVRAGKTLRKITIQDESHHIIEITLWGEKATQIEKEGTIGQAPAITSTIGRYTCIATIEDIHEYRGWYYVLCPECKNKAYPQGNNFACVDHEIIGEPLFMYSINTIISDGSSSIEAVFFNEAVTNIIHISCRDMVIIHGNKNPKVLPDMIHSIKKTSKLLHVNMKKDRTIAVNRAEDTPTLASTSTQSLLPKTPDPKMLTIKRPLHEPSGDPRPATQRPKQ